MIKRAERQALSLHPYFIYTNFASLFYILAFYLIFGVGWKNYTAKYSKTFILQCYCYHSSHHCLLPGFLLEPLSRFLCFDLCPLQSVLNRAVSMIDQMLRLNWNKARVNIRKKIAQWEQSSRYLSSLDLI